MSNINEYGIIPFGFKAIDNNLCSESGDHGKPWKVGEYRSLSEGQTVKPCARGYHSSDKPTQVLHYVQSDVMMIVERTGQMKAHKRRRDSEFDKVVSHGVKVCAIAWVGDLIAQARVMQNILYNLHSSGLITDIKKAREYLDEDFNMRVENRCRENDSRATQASMTKDLACIGRIVDVQPKDGTVFPNIPRPFPKPLDAKEIKRLKDRAYRARKKAEKLAAQNQGVTENGY